LRPLLWHGNCFFSRRRSSVPISDLQSLAAYPVGNRAPIEELTVTAKQPAADEGFSFWDFLDVINPLQHIPVVNTIYREMTGDEIKAPAKLIGSAILGGPVGLAAAMVDTAIEDSTGKDLGGHAMAFVRVYRARIYSCRADRGANDGCGTAAGRRRRAR
jgi:hypothetical protein